MLKAVIFDLNGVFLKSEHLSKRFENKYGIPENKFIPVLDEVMKVARKPGCNDSFNLWKLHLRRWGLNIKKNEFFKFWFLGESIVAELIEYVKDLRSRNIKVFILSNNFKERTQYYRKYFKEIFKNVDNSYFSWETGYLKPDKKAYLNILKKNNLNKDEVIYFDDLQNNVELAKSIGINSYKFEGFEKTKNIIENHLKSHIFL